MDFARSARFYDAVYAARGKDYAREAERLRHWLAAPGHGRRLEILDVGCGTAEHLRHLNDMGRSVGVDRDAAMLATARRKVPEALFVRGDMCRIALRRRFDGVLCLFAAIGYLPGEEAVRAAVAGMAEHLRPGGLLLLEPPLGPERLAPAERSVLRLTHDGLRVTRVCDAVHEPGRLRIRFEYTLEGPHGSECFSEDHAVLTLPLALYVAALEDAGLSVRHDHAWRSGPGLLVGRRP